jgi:hypothetical protein
MHCKEDEMAGGYYNQSIGNIPNPEADEDNNF